MRITRIHYFFTAPNNLYWNKIGAEAELIEGDDVRQCLYSLKKTVEDFFYESKAAAEKQMEKEGKTFTTEKPKNQEEIIIEGINSCTELKVLESYALIAKSNSFIKEAYENKILEF